MARAGELPHSPYYGSDRFDAALADPARRDVRLDRRPRARRSPLAERAGRARLDRPSGATATATASSSTSGARRAGLLNQGWKDSGDAIRDRDGREADAADRARRGPGLRLRREAPDGRARAGCAARSSSPAGSIARPTSSSAASRRRSGSRTSATTRWPSTARSARLDAIGSNAGQCLWTGIVSPARARDVADRLLGPGAVLRLGDPDLRRRTSPATTRSATTPGTVWPHDTSLIAAGLKRYGFHDEANRIVGHVFEAAQHFDDVPPAGAVLRLRPRLGRRCRCRTRSPARRRRGRPGRRSCSSQTMLGLRAHADRRRAGAAPAEPARTGSARSRSRTSGSATRRSTCCSTAGAGRRGGGPAQGRRRLRHDPALSAVLPPADPTDRVATSGELLADAGARLRAARLRDGPARRGGAARVRDRRRPDDDPRPSRRAGRAGGGGTVRGRVGAAAGRRAGRVHPRDQGVPRARLRDRRARR